jgi:hypothetical protein
MSNAVCLFHGDTGKPVGPCPICHPEHGNRVPITAKFPTGFQCMACRRTFERLLDAQVHCCQGDPIANRNRIYTAMPTPRRPWWRRLWDWLQIDAPGD